LRGKHLPWWQALAGDRATQFEDEEITVAGDRPVALPPSRDSWPVAGSIVDAVEPQIWAAAEFPDM
jgi:hypothetical protein